MSSAEDEHCFVLLPTSIAAAAQQVARHTCQQILRAALRELSLQTLQQHVVVTTTSAANQEDEEEDDGRTSISPRVVQLSSRGWQDTQIDIARVAQRWHDKLTNQGYGELADMLQTMMDTEHTTLFAAAVAAAAADDTAPEAATRHGTSSIGTNDGSTITSYARLHRLGAKNHHDVETDDNGTDITNCIRQLDSWGRQAGQTEWPVDWSMVEQMAQAAPLRQYKSSTTTTTTDATTTMPPPSMMGTNSSETAIALPHGDKKKRQLTPIRRLAAGAWAARAGMEGGPANDASAARAPTAFHTCSIAQHELANQWSAHERGRLDQYVHPNDNDDDNRDHVMHAQILGALQELGRFHVAPTAGRGRSGTSRAAAIRTRLQTRQEYEVYKQSHTKVKYTVDQCRHVDQAVAAVPGAAHPSPRHHHYYLEFDLSDVWLDVMIMDDNHNGGRGVQHQQRQLYCLDALHVIALDEDAE